MLEPSPYRALRGSNYRTQYRQGHVYEAPVFYTQPTLIVARPLYDADTLAGGSGLPANILVEPPDAFQHPSFPHLRLSPDEEFLLVKAKRRPVVILSADEVNAANETVLVVPLYSADNYRPEFVERVQQREYPGLIYLPADPGLGRKAAIVRFEHTQVVAKTQLIPKPLATIDDTLQLMLDALAEYLGQ